MPLDVVLVPCLRDNYAFLLHDQASGATAVVDTPEAEPILEALDQRGWTLTYILNTHHHPDHVGGNQRIKDAMGCQVIGPAAERDLIPCIDVAVSEGDTVQLGQLEAVVWETPAHTRGHVSYYFHRDDAIFVGDTLFAVGCGRLFEGTAGQMWSAMARYRTLPDHTRVYCGHEYTASNIRFARHIDPDNASLARREDVVTQIRARGEATIPTTIGLERATNPFMRADDPGLATRVECLGASPSVVLGEMREQKNHFRG